MKILGVLGGMGPQASIRFYDLLIKISIEKYGVEKNADFPHVLIDNIPVPDLVMSKDNEEKTVEIVENEARRLAKAGASVLVLACNTMHLYKDRIAQAGGIPFLSMVDSVVEKVTNDRIQKIGLLGTITTMRSGLYTDPLQKANIEVILPSEEDQNRTGALIHAVIAGNINTKEQDALSNIMEQLSRNGAEAIILGCTELPLLIQKTIAMPIYDSLKILADCACKEICAPHTPRRG